MKFLITLILFSSGFNSYANDTVEVTFDDRQTNRVFFYSDEVSDSKDYKNFEDEALEHAIISSKDWLDLRCYNLGYSTFDSKSFEVVNTFTQFETWWWPNVHDLKKYSYDAKVHVKSKCKK